MRSIDVNINDLNINRLNVFDQKKLMLSLNIVNYFLEILQVQRKMFLAWDLTEKLHR